MSFDAFRYNWKRGNKHLTSSVEVQGSCQQLPVVSGPYRI